MYVPAFVLLTTTSELLCTIKTHNNYHNANYCGIADIFLASSPGSPIFFNARIEKDGEPGDKANIFLLWMQVFLKKKRFK